MSAISRCMIACVSASNSRCVPASSGMCVTRSARCASSAAPGGCASATGSTGGRRAAQRGNSTRNSRIRRSRQRPTGRSPNNRYSATPASGRVATSTIHANELPGGCRVSTTRNVTPTTVNTCSAVSASDERLSSCMGAAV